jgi:hypothetical protein
MILWSKNIDFDNFLKSPLKFLRPAKRKIRLRGMIFCAAKTTFSF